MLKHLVLAFTAMLMLGFGGTASADQNYTVKTGNKFLVIVRNACGDTSEYLRIANENGIRNPNLIHPGKELTIRCKVGTNVETRVEPALPRVEHEPVHIEEKVDFVQVGSFPIPTVTQNGKGLRIVFFAEDTGAAKAEPVAQVASKTVPQRMAYLPRPKRQHRATSQFNYIELAIAEYFRDEGLSAVQEAAAIFRHESGLQLNAKGWNCEYEKWSWRHGRKIKVYTACKPEDRGSAKNWSVDCGVAQINVRGQVCPAELMTLEGNLAAAKKLYDERGFEPWVSKERGYYRQFMGRYSQLGLTPNNTVPTETYQVAQAAPRNAPRLVVLYEDQ
jgi:hypothetical protein